MKTHPETGNNGVVSTATASQTAPAHPVVNRPNVTTVGFIVFLASDLMFFAALFAMYFTVRSVVPELWEARTQILDIPYALGNTLILVSSSFTCQIGVFAAERFRPRRTGSLFNIAKWGMVEWFYLTFALGAIFVSGQVMEYATLVSEGISISSDGYGSVFYLTTGFHGIHVTIGLICFLLVIGRAHGAKKFGHHEATFAICVSYYWHFVDVVWIGLFGIIYLLQ
ncbi:cytochrome c oxidase subunit 3 [Brevibacterium iodinum ATCC 49514]|uniref:cytochrome-c oxidase n=1 Tax=Brevibacterium iodinum ATCC 49514 TaxID=1255616 RepID=A0A2H1I291_9MICO|nr:cytochrome c oxidase subunit 3 [Brevibacterium iodinum ATCC 49514]SUW12489.1 Cytochrome c oxidase subunit 3 [Brevibacterium iodinum]